jgi:nucleoside-diphosphate-sugar epimerase
MKQNPLSADLQHILDHTRDLWEELRGARIFITGGTGFFGCWLLESFLHANRQLGLKASISVLTRRPDFVKRSIPHLMRDPSVTLYQGDVRNFEFPNGEFSHIIHAATDASANLNNENPFLMLDTIIEGTRRTLDFALHCHADKFMLTSSGAVYGRQPYTITHIAEDYQGAPNPLDPQSTYGQGKHLAEHLCTLHAMNSTMQLKIARCFAFVGPYLPLDIHFAIGNFIRDAMYGGPIIIKGDGTPHRSYLYAADLAIWLWTILLKGQSLHPYNVGSDESLCIADIARVVAEQFPDGIKVEIHGKLDPTKSIEHYVPSIHRAKCELGLQQFIPLGNGIKRTLAYLGEKIE